MDIASHIAIDNPAASKRVLKALRDSFSVLATNPRIGRLQDNLRAGLRVFPGRTPAHNYVILYYQRDHGIEVSAIIHGARDWAAMTARGNFDS